jgi:hypothetical protein
VVSVFTLRSKVKPPVTWWHSVVAFHYLRYLIDPLLELAELLRCDDRDSDERRDVEADLAGVDKSMVTLDDSGVFELADALHHRWRAQADGGPDVFEGALRIMLQLMEQLPIDFIENESFS